MTDQPRPPPAVMAADMQAMLVYIQGARIVSMARETAISQLKGWLIGRLWFGIALAVVALVLLNGVPSWDFSGHAALLSALVLVVLASRAGAIVSIGRRMTDDNLGVGVSGDSIFTLASLGSGRNGLALALLTSNVFGLVVVALFASGLPATLGFVGGIAPVFSDVAINVIRDKADQDAIKASGLRTKLTDLETACAAPRAAAATASTRRPTPSPARAMARLPTTAPEPTLTAGTAPGGTPPTPPAALAATAPETGCSALALEVAGEQAASAEAMAKASRDAVAAFARLAPTGGSAEDKWFAALAASLGLETVPDLFKLLVWAFIAGFFEKLVPDMLDTLAARAKDSKLKEDAVQR